MLTDQCRAKQYLQRLARCGQQQTIPERYQGWYRTVQLEHGYLRARAVDGSVPVQDAVHFLKGFQVLFSHSETSAVALLLHSVECNSVLRDLDISLYFRICSCKWKTFRFWIKCYDETK